MLLQIFRAICVTSAVGSALTIILLLLKPFTKRIFGSRWQYYMWLTVLVVMVVPVTISLPQTNAIQEATPVLQTETVNHEYAEVFPVADTNLIKQNPVNMLKSISHGIPHILCNIWLVGMVLILGLHLVRYFIFLWAVRKNSTIVSCEALGTNKITVRKTNIIETPLMVGLFRHTMLLPGYEMKAESLNHIILHELTHYRRRDLLYKWFAMLVSTIHWFNPLVYILLHQIDVECEISCDLSVIENMNEKERNSYMNTILDIASHMQASRSLLTTAMASNKSQIIRRFALIRNFHKIGKSVCILSVVIAIVIFSTTVLASGILSNITKIETLEMKQGSRLGVESGERQNPYIGQEVLIGEREDIQEPEISQETENSAEIQGVVKDLATDTINVNDEIPTVLSTPPPTVVNTEGEKPTVSAPPQEIRHATEKNGIYAESNRLLPGTRLEHMIGYIEGEGKIVTGGSEINLNSSYGMITNSCIIAVTTTSTSTVSFYAKSDSDYRIRVNFTDKFTGKIIYKVSFSPTQNNYYSVTGLFANTEYDVSLSVAENSNTTILIY